MGVPSGPPCHTLYGKLREKGFRDALAAQGVPLREDWILHLGEIDYNLSLAAARNLFSKPDHPDAVFTVSDVYAAGITRSLAQIGLRVPEDVSVTGYDNSLYAQRGTGITTIAHPQEKLGEMAAELILEKINGVPEQESKVERLIQPELIIRGSSRRYN